MERPPAAIDLPAEVWVLITRQLSRRKDVAAVCLTCRHLNKVATPLLYESVLVSFKQLSHNFDDELPRPTASVLQTGSERRLRFAKELIFDFSDVSQCADHTDYSHAEQQNVLSDLLRSLLSQVEVPRLRSLRFIRLPCWFHNLFFRDGIIVHDKVFRPPLTRLTVDVGYTIVLPGYDFTWCSSLTELSLYLPLNAVSIVILQSILKNSHHSLRKLSWGRSRHHFGDGGFNRFSEIFRVFPIQNGCSILPALSHLSISDKLLFRENTLPGVLNAAHLQTLELDECHGALNFLHQLAKLAGETALALRKLSLDIDIRSAADDRDLSDSLQKISRLSPHLEFLDLGLRTHLSIDWRSLLNNIAQQIARHKKALRFLSIKQEIRLSPHAHESADLSSMSMTHHKQLGNLICLRTLCLSLNIVSLNKLAGFLPELAARSKISSLVFYLNSRDFDKSAEYWNPNSIFNWPESTDWYTRPQKSDAKAANICKIFDVSLTFTTKRAPFDLQKVLHWAFGSTGFSELELLLLIMPGGSASDEFRRSAFCRNGNACPWDILDRNGEVSYGIYPSVYPTFRSLRPSDHLLAERVRDIAYSMPRHRRFASSELRYAERF